MILLMKVYYTFSPRKGDPGQAQRKTKLQYKWLIIYSFLISDLLMKRAKHERQVMAI